MVHIIKRDGTIQPFDINKPLSALSKVYKKGLNTEVNEELKEKLSKLLTSKYGNVHKDISITIDEMQDVIRDFLMKYDKSAAESFIIYREQRNQFREENSLLQKQIKSKLFAKNVVNQNANLDEHSFGGRIGESASLVCKNYALRHSMSKKSRHFHENNEIYQHDLDSFAVGEHNCLSCPTDDRLRYGMDVRQTNIRPAHSLNTAFQLVAVDFQLQSLQQFGGVSTTHLDWTMVPFFRWSFYKHFLNGLRYIYDEDVEEEFKYKVGIESDYEPPKHFWDIIISKGNNNKSHLKREEEVVPYLSIEDDEYTRYRYKKVYSYALDMTLKELHQSIEAMFHNLNSLQSRSGNQLPFSSINYGTCTLREGQYVIDALIDGQISGTGKHHRTSIFPCAIFQWNKDINGYEGTPNYQYFRKALYSTSKRIYPNYVNTNWSIDYEGQKFDRNCKKSALFALDQETCHKFVEWIKNNKEDAEKMSFRFENGKVVIDSPENVKPFEVTSTMGCRTYNSYDINCDTDFWIEQFTYIAKHNELPRWKMWSANQKDGRGNICPVTIILPTLAMIAKEMEGDIVENFFNVLENRINAAKDMLIERFTLICSQSNKAAPYMYTNNQMYGYDGEHISSALKHGTLAIGQLGLAETLQILIGCNQTQPIGMELAKRIEDLFKTKCKEFKNELHLNFGVYYTPAENLCKTALQKFRDKYGVIDKVSDKDFFTNSIHVPVYYNVDVFEKIDIESELTSYSSAGCISYVELDSSVSNNIDALEKIVNYAMEHDIPYFAINIPLDYCRDCHTQGDFNGSCPECGSSNIEMLRRVTGYLAQSVEHMNSGKQDEVSKRVRHTGLHLYNKLY